MRRGEGGSRLENFMRGAVVKSGRPGAAAGDAGVDCCWCGPPWQLETVGLPAGEAIGPASQPNWHAAAWLGSGARQLAGASKAFSQPLLPPACMSCLLPDRPVLPQKPALPQKSSSSRSDSVSATSR